jgi:hypothetical protein
LLQAKGAAVAWTYRRRRRCSGTVSSPAGSPAAPTGPPATKSQGKTTKLKRRPRGFHLRAREEGEDAGEEDPGAGGTPAAVLWRRCCRGVEELRGAVWFGEGARGFLYRAERGAEEARLRRWAARSVVAAINGEARCGGGFGRGRGEVAARGSARPVGRWSGAGEERREGGTAAREAGGRAVWPAMEAARGWGRPRQVGPTCRRL